MRGGFRMGEWRVEPDLNRLCHSNLEGHEVRIDPKAMEVLVYMAEHAGELVRKRMVVDAVWEGSTSTDEVLTNSIWELRKAVGDDARSPRYIQTVPRKGYRLLAEVVPDETRAGAGNGEERSFFQRRIWVPLIAKCRRHAVYQNTVAIFPFTYRGSEELSYLGEGVVALLSAEVDAAGGWSSVDHHALRDFVQSRSASMEKPNRARRIARRLGAGLFLLGDIVEVGGRFHLRASLYASDRDSGPVARTSLQGGKDEFFQLTEQMIERILPSLGESASHSNSQMLR